MKEIVIHTGSISTRCCADSLRSELQVGESYKRVAQRILQYSSLRVTIWELQFKRQVIFCGDLEPPQAPLVCT